jgi:hypothetical protein
LGLVAAVPTCIRCAIQDSSLNFLKINAAGMCEIIYFLDPKCEIYNSGSKCISCKPNTNSYINNGKCLTVTIPITNCIQYDAAQKCLLCNENYFLDTSTYTCTELDASEKVTDCIAYEDGQCITCKN